MSIDLALIARGACIVNSPPPPPPRPTTSAEISLTGQACGITTVTCVTSHHGLLRSFHRMELDERPTRVSQDNRS